MECVRSINVSSKSKRIACGTMASSTTVTGKQPNATLQARPMAGARDERRLLGVACKRLFGQDFARHAALLLQLLLQRGEEAPIGPPCHDLLWGRLEHPNFMQPQGIKADRVFRAVVAPSPVGH